VPVNCVCVCVCVEGRETYVLGNNEACTRVTASLSPNK
jgi:hypothetical protein